MSNRETLQARLLALPLLSDRADPIERALFPCDGSHGCVCNLPR